MENADFMNKSREWRLHKLRKIGLLLLKIRFTPNFLTTLSLLSGLLGIYFLFDNYILFFSFALLHLLFDGLDGVVARLSTSTRFGDYYDHITDSLITFLALFKIGLYYGDYYAYVIAALFLLVHGVYYLSHQKAPLLFTRTITIIGLMIYIPGTFMEQGYLLILNYLVTGVAAAYSFSRQLIWAANRINQR